MGAKGVYEAKRVNETEPTLVDHIIRLLRPLSEGTWVLDPNHEAHVARLLEVAASSGRDLEGEVDEILKLLHVLETKHRSPETVSALISIIRSVPAIAEAIASRSRPSAALRASARALASFEGRRARARAPGLEPPATGSIPLFRLGQVRADALEARRVMAANRSACDGFKDDWEEYDEQDQC